MRDHVDMELRHGTCGTVDRADRAGLVEEVGEVGDIHRTRVSSSFSTWRRGVTPIVFAWGHAANRSISERRSRLAAAAPHPGPDDVAMALGRSEPTIDSMRWRRHFAINWRRGRVDQYVDYSRVGEFGRELQAWLRQVERELIPRDPAEALALAEAFIQGDEVFVRIQRQDPSRSAAWSRHPDGAANVP
jgi:hypothetical protein